MIGFNSLEESVSVFSILVITERSFVHTEQMVGKWWWNCFVLEKSMTLIYRERRKRSCN